jgi:flagellar basal-body rod protein FlgG
LKELWVPLSGAIAQQKVVETIANNVANANTPGFKKDDVVFKEYLSAYNGDPDNEVIDLPNKEWAPEDFYRSHGAENSLVDVAGTYTQHTQGSLNPTGNLLDLGLFGNGFFEILTPQGIRFTRKGSFSMSKDNNLVTDQGYFVLAKNNADAKELGNIKDRIINIPSSNVTVNSKGEIYWQGKNISQISTVEFKDLHSLQKEGSSLFINNHEENQAIESTKTSVHQGFVEESNVNPILEMSSLIKAHRQFDSIQKAIKTISR